MFKMGHRRRIAEFCSFTTVRPGTPLTIIIIIKTKPICYHQPYQKFSDIIEV